MRTWNKKTIDSLINKFTNSLNHIQSIETKHKIQETIDSLEFFKKLISPKKFGYKDTIESYQSDDLAYIDKYEKYCPIFREFDLSDEYISKANEKLSPINLQNKEIISFTRDFYHSIDNELANYLDKLLANSKTYFNFTKSPILFSDENSGFTFNIDNTNIHFIQVDKTNNLRTLLTTIHELAHAITFYLNEYHSKDNNKFHFDEVEALFLELLAQDYFGNILSKELDFLKIAISDYNENLYYNRIICCKLTLYDKLNKEQLKSTKEIKKFILANTSLLKQDIKDALYTTIDYTANNVISYLTAIELYIIYKQDKKEALKLLKNIIKLNNLSPDEYLDKINNLGILPTKSINSYLEELKVKEQKLCKNIK